MFDFILFENFRLASHHFYDLVLIARMMKSKGMRVAIFDVYHNLSEDTIDEIPVIHWQSKNVVPDDSWMLHKHNIWETLTHSFKLQIRNHFYFKEVVQFLYDKAAAFYCGSYHNGMSTQLFLMQKPCYYWGLRSDRLKFSLKKLFPSPLIGFHILFERNRFLKNPFQRLFVSNPIIMEEFERIGVPPYRMIIREERVIDKQIGSNFESLDKNVSFLVIGQLRKQKHVPLAIKAFQIANLPDTRLKLIGRSSNNYEKEITNAANNDNRIERVNAFLEYEDFFRFFVQSHFVLFADEKGKSCITNGTMMEALIHHRPIICPNYNPYSYYINTYGVGLLYNPEDVESFADALRKAYNLGVEYFQPAIEVFLKTISFEKISEDFVSNIRKIN